MQTTFYHLEALKRHKRVSGKSVISNVSLFTAPQTRSCKELASGAPQRRPWKMVHFRRATFYGATIITVKNVSFKLAALHRATNALLKGGPEA
jgi:hypothetical protein